MRFIISILFILFTNITYSQSKSNNTPMRLEFDAPASNLYNLVPMDVHGLLIFSQSTDKAGKDSILWNFEVYDIRFEKKWNKRIAIEQDMVAVDYIVNGSNLVVCFLANQKRNVSGVKLLRIDMTNGKYDAFAFDMPERVSIAGSYCLDSQIVLLANGRGNCRLTVFDLATQTLQSQQIITNLPNAEVTTAFADTLSGKLHIITTTDKQKQERSLLYHLYDSKTMSLNGLMLEPESANHKLMTGNCIATPDGLFIIGSYNKKNERQQQSDYTNYSESAGLFITKIENGKQTFIKTYNFIEFSKKLKEAVKKNNTEATDETSMNYLLISHQPVEINGGIQYIVETFQPEFRMVSETGYYNYSYGGVSPYTRTVFEGFRFNSAFIASFDALGNLSWSSAFNIWDLLTPFMSNRLHSMQVQNEQVLAYNNNGEVNYLVMEKDSMLTGTQMLRIEKKYAADRVLGSINGNMRYWYDNYYLAFGYQTIRNNRSKNSRRDVFYINKIAYK